MLKYSIVNKQFLQEDKSESKSKKHFTKHKSVNVSIQKYAAKNIGRKIILYNHSFHNQYFGVDCIAISNNVIPLDIKKNVIKYLYSVLLLSFNYTEKLFSYHTIQKRPLKLQRENNVRPPPFA